MELFAKPIFLFYLLGALLIAGGVLAIGKKLKSVTKQSSYFFSHTDSDFPNFTSSMFHHLTAF
jgi:hypothetical protein